MHNLSQYLMKTLKFQIVEPVGELPIGLEITFCSSVLSPEGKDQFCKAVPYLPTTQSAKRLKAKARRRWNRPKGGSPSVSTTKLIAGGIGSTWVQLERVNPSPSPTHSARESE
ncbi:hypothetical protein H5410_051371 [Solanum commersonii]|uniref:Uncharacterized protein n=1 Tax=Solanum commersonii TaxID=4109 RepID=A0A9J5X0R7_SOLCO|nr:hypothetical protein H5410_051371 [Solanum commersonii]